MSKMLFRANKNVAVMSFHYIYGSHRTDIISMIITSNLCDGKYYIKSMQSGDKEKKETRKKNKWAEKMSIIYF